MMKEITLSGVLIAIILLLVSASGAAQTSNVVMTVGLKGAVGGNHMNAQDSPAGDDEIQYFDDGGAPFEGDVVGSGGGGGIFGEVRFWREHLGIELDLLLDMNRARCTVAQTSSVDVDYILTYSMLRVPLLLKAAFQSGATRIGVGIGPEFRLGLTATPALEVVNGDNFQWERQLEAWKSQYSAQKHNDVAIAWDVAFAFSIQHWEITVDLRVAHVLTYPETFEERVDMQGDRREPIVSVLSTHSMDGRVLLGVAYSFYVSR